jgi:ubiquinone/menaquinone biosynthesis C-methylase UbiE
MRLAATRPCPPIEQVKVFWEDNPLCAAAIDAEIGSPEFFSKYDRLREINEPPKFARQLHEYDRFSGKRVLEVGCGNAYTLAKYAEHGAFVYGVDITETAVEISKKRFQYRNLAGEFRVANAEELPYESNFFDCICSMGVLHHVPNTTKAVNEIHRCLKPGGRLIVMFYHKNSFLYQIYFRTKHLLTGKSMNRLVNEVDGRGNPKGDVYSKEELKELLYKFESIEMFTGFISIPKTNILIPSSMESMLGKRFGWFLYAKGNKKRA